MNNNEAFALLSGIAQQHHDVARGKMLIEEIESVLVDAMGMLQRPTFGQCANEIAGRISHLLEKIE